MTDVRRDEEQILHNVDVPDALNFLYFPLNLQSEHQGLDVCFNNLLRHSTCGCEGILYPVYQTQKPNVSHWPCASCSDNIVCDQSMFLRLKNKGEAPCEWHSERPEPGTVTMRVLKDWDFFTCIPDYGTIPPHDIMMVKVKSQPQPNTCNRMVNHRCQPSISLSTS